MEKIARKKEKQKSNVFDIGDNPRFGAKHIPVIKPVTYKANDRLFSHRVTKNLFGFVAGDTIICRANFNESEFTPNTIVVCKHSTGMSYLAIAAHAENISGVVIAFQREVSL